jgi:hypothetical protein
MDTQMHLGCAATINDASLMHHWHIDGAWTWWCISHQWCITDTLPLSLVVTSNALVLIINVMTIDTGRSPRTLRAVMTVIADDFHVGETRGYPVLDCTKDVDDRARSFRLKTVLLYVSADYPAQRLASGFSHSGKEACHYCEEVGRHSRGVSTIVHGRRVDSTGSKR